MMIMKVLGSLAMLCNVNLWKFTAPHLTEVGEVAFSDCSNLVAVLPSVKIVGKSAFSGCYSLSNVKLSPHFIHW